MALRILILGGGPAGYAAANTAAQFGADATIVERERLGGSCTIWDAIPSKTLLNTADGFSGVEHAQRSGLEFGDTEPIVDFTRMMRRVREVIDHQCGGVEQRLTDSRVRIVKGEGTLVDANTLQVTRGGGQTTIGFDKLIIATGARPWVPDFVPDDRRMLTTRTMWQLDALPESVVVVGSGATGCEMADFFQRCGTQVTMISSRDRILPQEDVDVAWVVEDAFLARGMNIMHRSRSGGAAVDGDGVRIDLQDGASARGQYALFAVGMQPNTEELNLEAAGIKINSRGAIKIDEQCVTSTDNIYAVGDVTGGVMLANIASMQGRHAVLHALGNDAEPIRHETVASTTFTTPEVADVGLTESMAEEQGRTVQTVSQPLRNNPRAVIHGSTDGLVKIVFDPTNGEVLGASIVGYRASELIMVVALAIRAQLTVHDLAETGAVNPSVSESLQRAAERAASMLPGTDRRGDSSSVTLG